MSDKSKEWLAIVADAQKLLGSIKAGIYKVIENYKTPSDNKESAELEKPAAQTPPPPTPPTTPSVTIVTPAAEKSAQEPKEPVKPTEPASTPVDSVETHKDSDNKQ